MILKKPPAVWAWVAFSCLAASLVGLPSLQANEKNIAKITGESKPEEPSASEDSSGFVGMAVYYKKHYHGRKTHSGKIHHPQHMTAAHPTLPHGTKVKVVNLANNHSVIVTINDRCRKRSSEVIDLSRAAAGKLGFLGQGNAKVRIIPLEAK